MAGNGHTQRSVNLMHVLKLQQVLFSTPLVVPFLFHSTGNLTAFETLGGLHSGAVVQVRQLAASLARCKGLEEGRVTSQLFGRLSLTLMRGNALMLSTLCQEVDFSRAEVDGVE